jgi:hypothetical protein
LIIPARELTSIPLTPEGRDSTIGSAARSWIAAVA